MVYRPAMSMSQSLDVIFPSPRIYFTVEFFCVSIAHLDGRQSRGLFTPTSFDHC